MRLSLTRQASKALESLDAKQFRQVMLTVIGLLKNPEPHDSSLLKGSKHGERRVDVGEYRAIYAIRDDTVEVIVIGKRNDDDVYNIWKRQQQ
jgi:mRNA interferase RelE/StbE